MTRRTRLKRLLRAAWRAARRALPALVAVVLKGSGPLVELARAAARIVGRAPEDRRDSKAGQEPNQWADGRRDEGVL